MNTTERTLYRDHYRTKPCVLSTNTAAGRREGSEPWKYKGKQSTRRTRHSVESAKNLVRHHFPLLTHARCVHVRTCVRVCACVHACMHTSCDNANRTHHVLSNGIHHAHTHKIERSSQTHTHTHTHTHSHSTHTYAHTEPFCHVLSNCIHHAHTHEIERSSQTHTHTHTPSQSGSQRRGT